LTCFPSFDYIWQGKMMLVTTRFLAKSFQCPVCAGPFTATTVEAVTHQGQDSDFFPHYLGDDPLPFFLVQCPGCQYCAYPDDFAVGEFQKHPVKFELIKTVLTQPISRKLPPDAVRYYLAGKIYEAQQRNPYFIGNLYLRGSWCCRRGDNRKAEIELQQLAVKFLRESVERSTVGNPDNLPAVTYLVGELYRRLEDKALAREWFGTVEEVVSDAEQQWILDLAKKQAELNEHFLN